MLALLLNNKKLVLLVIAFLVLFPLGFYGLRINTDIQVRTPDTISVTTIPQLSPTITSPILPEEDPQKKLLDYIQNRRPLSEADTKAKTYILGLLQGKTSGIVYQNRNYTVEYIQSADLFQVEILTSDTDAAKDDASLWFKNQGISDQGICNLPISFYLNFDVKNEIGETASSFNPLPRNC